MNDHGQMSFGQSGSGDSMEPVTPAESQTGPVSSASSPSPTEPLSSTAPYPSPLPDAVPSVPIDAAIVSAPNDYLSKVAARLSSDDASELERYVLKHSIARDDVGGIVAAAIDVQRRSSRTLLDDIENALGSELGSRVREKAEQLNLGPNDPRLIGYALNQDLESTIETLPDAISKAAATLTDAASKANDGLQATFKDGIASVERAAAAYGAKELVTFDAAFARVAADRLTILVRDIVKVATNPLTKYALAAVVVVGMALAYAAGYGTGRAQIAGQFRTYEAEYPRMNADVRRFSDGFWK